MKQPQKKPNETLDKLLSLSEDGVKMRETWRSSYIPIGCILLGVFGALVTVFGGVGGNTSKLVVFLALAFKFLPILWVVNQVAQKKAADYLSDIFEIENDEAAAEFIESAVFGHTSGSMGMKNVGYDAASGKNVTKMAMIYKEAKITVKDGKISEADEQSPLMLIGGPGAVKVGLDYLVMFEKFTGEPNFYHPSDKPWKIGRYDRIREVGEHQYAIINLRDQFFSGISVLSRTKDGIPIEAQDVKVIFSVLRRKPANGAARDASLLYDPEAVKSLIYNQTMIESDDYQTFGASFPWDNIMLMIVSEIEDLIKTSLLSEILANTGQKEVDARLKTDQSIETIKVELTRMNKSVPPAQDRPANNASSNFKSRSAITARFYAEEFVKKATEAGIHLQWIDIGTWKTPAEKIMDKHKDAWSRSLTNAANKIKQEKEKTKKAQTAFVKLIDEVIIKKYDKTAGSSGKTSMRFNKNESKEEEEDEEEGYEDDDGFYSDYGPSRRFKRDEMEKNPEKLAQEILKAISKELLSAEPLIQQEDPKIIAALQKALRHISALTAHFVGSK